MLEAAGNSASDAVMTPVTETLDALPTTDPPGRLTKPLRRTGFEALQGVTIAARPSKPVHRSRKPKKPAAGREPSASARSARPISRSSRWRRSGCDLPKRPSAKRRRRVDRAKRTLERAERTRERIEGELEEATVAEKAARKELSASESASRRAKAESDRLRKKIG